MIKICFTRIDGHGILDAMIVLAFQGPDTQEDAMRRLERAVTQWVEETETGKLVWQQSNEDLNIGDIVDFMIDPFSSLVPFLIRHSIHQVDHLYTLTETSMEPFDTILAHPKEI